jgi:hypothetical protein
MPPFATRKIRLWLYLFVVYRQEKTAKELLTVATLAFRNNPMFRKPENHLAISCEYLYAVYSDWCSYLWVIYETLYGDIQCERLRAQSYYYALR